MRLLEVKRNIIVVYGGGFQPFHQGHMSSYEQAKAAFPNAKFFVAASNDVKTRPIPFEAKKFLAEQAGVTDPFVQVKSPLMPREILANFDPEVDILVLVRSERDPMAYTKKDGSPAYYQPWQGDKSAQPFGKNGYIFVTKKHDFHAAGQTVYSGSQVRQMYAEADEEGKQAIIDDLYPHGTNPNKIKQLFDQYLGGVKENISEEDTQGMSMGEEVEPDPEGYQKDLLQFPRYTVVVDTPGDLDWYKIGQHYPNLSIEDPHEYGQSDSDMTITVANKEELESLLANLKRLGFKTKVIGKPGPGPYYQPEIHSE